MGKEIKPCFSYKTIDRNLVFGIPGVYILVENDKINSEGSDKPGNKSKKL